jgi:glycine oxidase
MRSVEYLIVGQGLAGTMLAFEMLDRKISFRMMASTRRSRASVVAAGMINPLVFKRLTKSWMADEVIPFMWSRYRDLEQQLDASFIHKKKILKPLSSQEKLLWQEKKRISGFSGFIEEVTDKAPVQNIKDAVAYGLVNGSGYLDLSEFLRVAGKTFLDSGLLVYADQELLNEPDYLSLSHEYRAQKIIFCEGYHLLKNPLFHFVRMNPAKGEVLLVHAPDLQEEYILNKKVFVLPVGNHRFKIGSTYEWEDLSEQPTAKGKDSIIDRFENLIDTQYTIEQHWAGVRPTVSDRRPVLGRHPEYGNVYIFNGLGTKGVMLAPYFAREMVRFLVGDITMVHPETDVRRFLNGL